MEEREERSIEVSLDGKPLGRVKKIYSTTCSIEGQLPDWFRGLRDDDIKRKLLELKWQQLPELTREAAHEAAHILGSLLYEVGIQSISFAAMAEGKPCSITITLDR